MWYLFILFCVLYIVSNDENKADQLIIIYGLKQHMAKTLLTTKYLVTS